MSTLTPEMIEVKNLNLMQTELDMQINHENLVDDHVALDCRITCNNTCSETCEGGCDGSFKGACGAVTISISR